jgi:hypothetical protein
MASAYEGGGYPHLWLPKFWAHQVINRPTESQLHAHPEDPYGHLPIKQALDQFREDSLSDSLNGHGGLTPSRVGGRSLPFPSPAVDVSNNSNVEVSETQAEQALFDYWREQCGHSDAKFTADRRAKLRSRRREGYTDEQIRQAIDGAAKAPFVNDAGKRFDDLELVCRTGSKLESFIGRKAATGDVPIEQLTGHDKVRAERAAALRDRIEQSGLAL